MLLECRELFFRSKLKAVLTASGAELAREEPYDLAVIELGKAEAPQRITDLVNRGVPVLVFGSHVDAAALRAARDLGARAVPNSEVENALRALL